MKCEKNITHNPKPRQKIAVPTPFTLTIVGRRRLAASPCNDCSYYLDNYQYAICKDNVPYSYEDTSNTFGTGTGTWYRGYHMWLSQVEEVSSEHTLVSSNRRFCILAIQLDSRKSPEKNHRTWKRHVDQMESTGIGIDSRYLRDPVLIIPPASG